MPIDFTETQITAQEERDYFSKITSPKTIQELWYKIQELKKCFHILDFSLKSEEFAESIKRDLEKLESIKKEFARILGLIDLENKYNQKNEILNLRKQFSYIDYKINCISENKSMTFFFILFFLMKKPCV